MSPLLRLVDPDEVVRVVSLFQAPPLVLLRAVGLAESDPREDLAREDLEIGRDPSD
jgi:hypothetical protein